MSNNNIAEDLDDDSRLKKDLSGLNESSSSKIKIKKIETNLGNMNLNSTNPYNNKSEANSVNSSQNNFHLFIF